MFNQVLLAGRLVAKPELISGKEEKNKRTRICLAVQRPFKSRGSEEYQTDFFYVTLWEGIAESVQENCHKGTIVIVKGRLEQNIYEDKETHKKVYGMNIIGERLVYIGSPKPQENPRTEDIDPDLRSEEEEKEEEE